MFHSNVLVPISVFAYSSHRFALLWIWPYEPMNVMRDAHSLSFYIRIGQTFFFLSTISTTVFVTLTKPIWKVQRKCFGKKFFFVRKKNWIKSKALSSDIEPYIFIVMHSVKTFGILTRIKMPEHFHLYK